MKICHDYIGDFNSYPDFIKFGLAWDSRQYSKMYTSRVFYF